LFGGKGENKGSKIGGFQGGPSRAKALVFAAAGRVSGEGGEKPQQQRRGGGDGPAGGDGAAVSGVRGGVGEGDRGQAIQSLLRGGNGFGEGAHFRWGPGGVFLDKSAEAGRGHCCRRPARVSFSGDRVGRGKRGPSRVIRRAVGGVNNSGLELRASVWVPRWLGGPRFKRWLSGKLFFGTGNPFAQYGSRGLGARGAAQGPRFCFDRPLRVFFVFYGVLSSYRRTKVWFKGRGELGGKTEGGR